MSSTRETSLRQPWHPPAIRVVGRRRRWRQFLATFVVIALIGLLVYLSLTPFWHPDTTWAGLTETRYSPAIGLPLPETKFGVNEKRSLPQSYSPQLRTLDLTQVNSPADITKLLRQLQESDLERADALIIDVRARGMIFNDQPMLVCRNYFLGDTRQGLYPIERLIDRIAGFRPSVKLLILETEDQTYDARLGQIPGRFVTLAQNLVRDKHDSEFWLMTSHGDWQHTQYSPALRATLFRFWLTHAVRGYADEDESESVDIGELHRYLADKIATSSSFRSDGTLVQIPELSWGGGELSQANFPEILSTFGFERDDSEVKIASVIESLQAEQDVTEGAEAEDPPAQASPPEVASSTDEVISEDVKDDASEASEVTPEKVELTTLEQIEECWEIIRTFEFGEYPQPSDMIPSVWNAISQKLFWYEQVAWDNPDGSLPESVVAAINQLHFALTELKSGEPVPASVEPHVSSVSKVWQQFSPAPSTKIADLINDEEGSIRSWIRENPEPPTPESTAEDLLYQLADDLALSERSIRLAVSVHLLADRVDDHPCLRGDPIRDRILRADRLRLLGTRLLSDRTRRDWEAFATSTLREAGEAFRAIADDLQLLGRCERLRNQLIIRLPEYLRLRLQLAVDVPDFFFNGVELERLFQQLFEVDGACRDEDFESLARLYRQMLPLANRVTTDPEKAAAAVLQSDRPNVTILGILSRSSGVPRSLRSAINAALVTIDEDIWQAYDLNKEQQQVEIAETAGELRREILVQNAKAETELFRLAAVGLDLVPGFEPLDESSSEIAISRRFQRLALGYQQIVSTADRTFQQSKQLRDSEAYSAVRTRFDALVRAVRCIDWRYLEQLDLNATIDYMVTVRDTDAMRLRYLKLVQAKRDARADELAFIKQAIESIRVTLNVSPVAPPLTVRSDHGLSLSATDGVSLESQSEAQVTLEIRLTADTTEPVWILLDYDESLLEVTSSGSTPLLARWPLRAIIETKRVNAAVQSQWNSIQNRTSERQGVANLSESLRYPVDPSTTDLPPTLLLEPGSTKKLVVNVRRLQPTGRPTKLIAKAISSDAYVRRTIAVSLPNASPIDLVSDDRIALTTTLPDGLILHPLPNRQTVFHPAIRNESVTERKFDFMLYQLDRPVTTEFPIGAFSRERASKMLESLGSFKQVASRPETSVAPRSTLSLPVLFFQTAEESVDPNAEGEPMPPVSFDGPYGFLLRIDDRQEDSTILRKLLFAVQRPRAFLRPSLSYDALTRELEIQVFATDVADIPKDGIHLTAHIQSSSAVDEATVTGILTSSNGSTKLSTVIPTSSVWADVTIDVDSYPRAFQYRLPCSKTVQSFDQQSDRSNVRISLSKPETIVPGSAVSVPVRLFVDAPAGMFPFENFGQDYVDVGLDVDRDRELRDERIIRLKSDRSVDLTTSFVGDELMVDAEVGDFSLQIPTFGASDSRVNVLAKLTIGEQQVWSEPVEVVLDRSGPIIERIELFPDRAVGVDGTLEVRVRADDNDLSGVEKVELLVDRSSTGMMPEDAELIEAEQDDLQQWIAEVPFKDLRPGTYDVLVRATDLAGNQGAIKPIAVKVLDAGSLRAMSENNLVSGTVTFDQEPLTSARVTLTPLPGDDQGDPGGEGDSSAQAAPDALPPPTETDKNGQFVFSSVASGRYRIRAIGLARNKPRIAELEIEVKPKPAKSIRIRMIAQ